MTTLLFLALLNKADDVESVREISLLATREKIEATVTDFGLPALKVLLEDTESAAGTLGIAEVKVGKNLWEKFMREDRPPGILRDASLGQAGRFGKKVVDIRMRVIRNSPEAG